MFGKPGESLSTSFWPSQEQELLLIAALAEGQTGLAAWERWSKLIGFDGLCRIDEASRRLTPLLYHNLSRLRVQHPLIPRLKNIYFRTWYENHLLLRRLESVLDSLTREGVSTIVLKGVPLALSVYQDIGLRPMDDVDIMVPTNQADRATNILRQHCFEPLGGEMPFGRHAHPHVHPNGTQVDLHVSPFSEMLSPSLIAPMWADACSFTVGRANTRALSSSDQLLHVIAHGARANRVPPIRWVADALLLLRADPSLDWQKVLARSTNLHLTVTLRETLVYLVSRFDAPVPDFAIQALSEYRPTTLERVEFVGRGDRSKTSVVFAIIFGFLVRYAHAHAGAGTGRLWWSFPTFLRQRLQTKGLTHTVYAVFSIMLRWKRAS
jgi:hypothetical protein